MSFDHELSDDDIAQSQLGHEDFDQTAHELVRAFESSASHVRASSAMRASLERALDGSDTTSPKRTGLAGRRRWTYAAGIAAAVMLVVSGLGIQAIATKSGEDKLDASSGVADSTSQSDLAQVGPEDTKPSADNGEEEPSEPPSSQTGATFDFSDPSSLETSFDVGLYHRDDVVVEQQNWPGDFAPSGGGKCTGSGEKRQIERGDRSAGFNRDWIYRCDVAIGTDQILVTSIGDASGYSIGAFSPKPAFTNVKEIRWDVTISDLGNRQWTEVAVIPEGNLDFQNLPCDVDRVSCNSASHRDIGSVGVSFYLQEMLINPSQNGGITVSDGSWQELFPDDQAAAAPSSSSPAVRRTHFLRQEIGTDGQALLTFGIERADGTFVEQSTPGAFPDGPVRVVFSDHNFTPLKSETIIPTTFSWQWDNISIS